MVWFSLSLACLFCLLCSWHLLILIVRSHQCVSKCVKTPFAGACWYCHHIHLSRRKQHLIWKTAFNLETFVISQTYSFAPKRVNEISGTLDAVEHEIERRFLIVVLFRQLGSPLHLHRIITFPFQKCESVKV